MPGMRAARQCAPASSPACTRAGREDPSGEAFCYLLNFGSPYAPLFCHAEDPPCYTDQRRSPVAFRTYWSERGACSGAGPSACLARGRRGARRTRLERRSDRGRAGLSSGGVAGIRRCFSERGAGGTVQREAPDRERRRSSSPPCGLSVTTSRGATVQWQFRTEDARIKLKRLCPKIDS